MINKYETFNLLDYISKRKYFSSFILLVLSTLFVYIQLKDFNYINYDDDLLVFTNENIKFGLTFDSIIWAFTDGTFLSNYWQPLTWISHIIDFNIFEMDAGGHHLTSLIFHLINILLVLIFFNKVTNNFWISSFVALFFALHPIHVESVAWISERKDVLSTFFLLMTLNLYLQYAKKRILIFYCFTYLFFIFGLMSKPMVITLPFLLLMLDIWPLKRITLNNSNQFLKQKYIFFEKIPFFILTILLSYSTYLTQKIGKAITPTNLETLSHQIPISLISYSKYILKLLFPVDLALAYPKKTTFTIDELILSITFLFCISLIFFLKRKNRPHLLFGWCWYLGTLFPVIGIVQIGSHTIADRYAYIPFLGLYLMFAFEVYIILNKLKYGKIIMISLYLFFITFFIYFTKLQVSYWKNNNTIWNNSLNKTKNNWLAHNNLGVSLDDNGATDEAISHFQRALKIKPDYLDALNNIGISYSKLNQFNNAMDNFQHALNLNDKHPITHFNIGVTLAKFGYTDNATQFFLNTIDLKPDYIPPYIFLGNYYGKNNEIDKALSYYTKAFGINPKNELLNLNLANVYENIGDFDKSIDHYSRTTVINPTNQSAIYNLAVLQSNKGNIEYSIDIFKRLLSVNPNYKNIRLYLGILYFRNSLYEDAIKEFESLLQYNNENSDIHNYIAIAYNKIGQVSKAIYHYKESIVYNSNQKQALYNLGNIYFQNDLIEDAIDSFEKVIFLDEKNIDAINNLSLAYIKINNYKKAETNLRKALDINPNHKLAKKNLNLLLENKNK